MFTISGTVLGSIKNLYVHDSGAQWTSGSEGYLLGFPESGAKDLAIAFEVFNKKIPNFFPESFVKMFSELNAPAHLRRSMISPGVYKTLLINFASALREAFSEISESSYLETLATGGCLLSSLKPARIDEAAFAERLLNSKNVSAVKTFAPTSGYANRVVYDRSATVTGRLTVKSGPRILTLAKKDRHIIKPSAPGNKIFSLDFVSLEPRLLLKYLGKKPGLDVYSDFCKANNLQVSREQAKRAIVSTLYGGGVSSWGGSFSDSQAYSLQKVVKKYFDVVDTINFLESDIREGIINNIFGRPIEVGNTRGPQLLNWWIQSSAVDAALLGFHQILEEYNAKPLYVIHDAIIIEAASSPPESVCIAEFGDFPLKAEVLSE